MGANIQTDVLIVGAGPTGLALACQLERNGIDFVIAEQNEGVTPYSKAIGVHARTLEIYEQMGLAQSAIAEGTVAGKARLLAEGEVRGELDLSGIGEGLSSYPYMLLLEQSKNERLLYQYLQEHQREVLWQTGLESFSQNETGVTAQLKTADGATQTVEARYLVGCDGSKSPVRHALGLGFEGSTFERMFYVADAHVKWKFEHDSLHLCLSKNSLLLFFPLKGENRYRIVGSFPEGFEGIEGDVLYEEIEAHIKGEAHLELDIYDVEWFSTYKVHTRHVSQFSLGRCFLAGDAAHIHSPAGAQGMNTGIQDGYNLAWKLASVVKGRADESLLGTYNEERLENARHLLQTTDRLFQMGAGSEWWLAFFRTNILPSVIGPVLSVEAVKGFVFPLISQIGINYRQGSLSQYGDSEAFEIKAGDRMPYFLLNGESIYNQLREPKFHALIFSDAGGDWAAAKAELDGEYVNFLTLPLSAQVQEIFGTDQPFTVLLRPDNYIGFISAGTSVDRIKYYLHHIIPKSKR